MLQMSLDPHVLTLEIRQLSEVEFPLGQFYINVQQHLVSLSEIEHTMSLISTPFKDPHKMPAPVQCRRAIKSLNEVSKLAHDFCNETNQLPHLSQIYVTLHCKLFYILRVVEEMSSNLITLINSYRMTSFDHSSTYTHMQHEHISTVFQKLLSYAAEIPLQAEQIKDEAELYEQHQLAFSGSAQKEVAIGDENFIHKQKDCLKH